MIDEESFPGMNEYLASLPNGLDSYDRISLAGLCAGLCAALDLAGGANVSVDIAESGHDYTLLSAHWDG